MPIKNAKITSTMLGIEDHGIMTFYISLEWDGGGQSLGGYALDHKEGNRWIGHEGGFVAIRYILQVVGVHTWEQLKGQLVRLDIDDYNRRPPILGHILEDRWFNLNAFIQAADTKKD